MSKVKVFVICFLVLLFCLAIIMPLPNLVLAQSTPASACTISYSPDPTTLQGTNTPLQVTFQSNSLPSDTYYALLNVSGSGFVMPNSLKGSTMNSGSVSFTFQLDAGTGGWPTGQYNFYLFSKENSGDITHPESFDLSKASCTQSYNVVGTSAQKSCTTSIPTSPVNPDTTVGLQVNGISSGQYDIFISNNNGSFQKSPNFYDTSRGNTITLTNPQTSNTSFAPGNYTVALEKSICGPLHLGCVEQLECSTVTFSSVDRGTTGGGQTGTSNTLPSGNLPSIEEGSPANAGVSCTVSGTAANNYQSHYGETPPITNVTDTTGGYNGIQTVIGCIPTDPKALVTQFLKWALGAGGGVALLIMAFGSIQMIAAAGNPEAVKAGRERFTSALIGLLFIIFSVFLLKVIGVDILQIPGFGG